MKLPLPFTRLGLLLIVAAVFASVINFYVGIGTQLGDFDAEDLGTEPSDLLIHFRDNFLFAGSHAGWLFWAGIALCTLGIIRNFTTRSKKRR